jgi:hypothetical protein
MCVKLYRLILINAILYVGLGIAFALYGPIMIQVYGILDFPGAESGVFWFTASFARVLGAMLFGYGFLLWAVRDLLATGTLPAEKAQRTTLALLMGSILALFVAVTQQWQVWANPAGWVTIAIFLLLTFGYAYFLATKKF